MYRLRAELRAHNADVRGVAVSAAGVIATASRDTRVVLWDAGATEPRAVLNGHDHFVNAVAFVSEGQLLVSASADKTLRVWDVESGEIVRVLRGHEAQVCAVAAVPAAGVVVSSSWDKTARVWDVGTGACLKVFEGHEAAVWSAMGLPDGRFVTVSADKTIRVWPGVGSNGPGATLQQVHTDVVRAVASAPAEGFVTIANDSALVYWQPSDGAVFNPAAQLPDLHDGSYAYAVDSAESDPGKWMFVSGGEDNAVRVVEADMGSGGSFGCVQTIMHPGSVWSVALCPGGDIVSGCSDGVARVFTKDASAVADADTLSTFEKEVSERQISTKVIGGVDVTKLPEADAALAEPGKKDGENKMVRRPGGGAEVHVWSAADSRWTKIGDVVDNPGGGASMGGGIVNGKQYDFVFEVELGEGGSKEKLGYNRGENPYLAAQRFIDEQELNQNFLDQVAQFIEQQVPADALVAAAPLASDPLTGGSRYVPSGGIGGGGSGGDPLTGGSGYVPRGVAGSSDASSGGDPLTGGSRYVPSGSPSLNAARPLPPPKRLIPHPLGLVSYKNSDQLGKIQLKLSEFNAGLARENSDLALSQEEAEIFGSSLIPKLQSRDGSVLLEDAECAIVGKLLKWPTASVFPVLDIARLVVAQPSGAAYFFGKHNGDILRDVQAHMASPDAKAPVLIMGCRFLCNMFGNRVAGSTVRSECAGTLSCCTGAAKNENRRVRETHASLLVNYAVALHDSEASAEERAIPLAVLVSLISNGEADEEVLFRLMIAMGTLICDDASSAARGVALGVADAAATAAPVSGRIQQVALEIATIVAA